jgi:hypothetical protein
MRRSLPILALLMALAGFGTMLFAHLAYPLLWQDEGETVMFARRVVEYGYPKVHGPRNVVNEFGPHAAAGVKEASDAYIGKTWGDFYWAVPGLVWARGSDDVYERTWRLRLPFALTGAAGVVAMLWAVAPAVVPRRRLVFAAFYFALCASSVSLLLHLREVRYYGLLVLVMAAILGVHLRAVTFGRLRYRRYVALQALLLVLLFHVFFAAWFAVTALLGLDAGRRAWRAPPGSGGGSTPGRVGRALLPHALSAVAVTPGLWFFETFAQAAGFSRSLGLSPALVIVNLGDVTWHLLRYELLLPALCARLAVAIVCQDRPASEVAPARRAAALLLAFAAGYAVIGCLNPLVYERYFVVLGPLLILAFLLDAMTLLESVRISAAGRRGAVVATGLCLALLAGGATAWRAPEIAGRLAEIRTPYRGPLDFIVPHLLERYPHPEKLIVATNYEAYPLMYYLGSRVIVGLALNNIVAERALVPDVVIPRRGWPRSLVEIRRILSKGGYRAEELPVRDIHYNNIPSLGRFGATPDPHRFRTPWAEPGTGLRVYHRVDERPDDAFGSSGVR